MGLIEMNFQIDKQELDGSFTYVCDISLDSIELAQDYIEKQNSTEGVMFQATYQSGIASYSTLVSQ